MRRRTGFTLVELVVVILILGILTAVAAPKMFNTSGKATDNGLRQSLAIVRDGIELYASQNGGSYPPCTSTGADFRTALTPYVRGIFPSCPVGPALNFNVSTTPPSAAPTNGWYFNTSTGAFSAAFTGASATGGTYDTF